MSSNSHDRLLGTYSYTRGHVLSADQPDFNEDDVWPTSSSSELGSFENRSRFKSDRIDANDWTKNILLRQVGGLSLAFEDRYSAGPMAIHQHCHVGRPNKQHVTAASAPVNVPAWSNLVRVDSTDLASGSVELDRDESERIPPHEYLEREYGKSDTTSVVEGKGRTLKGRDMSRVCNAVWSQTGFFG